MRSLHRVVQIQRRGAEASELGEAALGLLHLVALAPIAPGAAADELGTSAQTVTRAVADLERRGLARREEDAGDGRSYRIVLTEKGHQAREAFRRDLTEAVSGHLREWDAADIERFARDLERFVSSVERDLPARPRSGVRRNHWRSRA